MSGSNELFYLDADGNKRDAELHEEILDNLEARRRQSKESIELAVAKGFSRADAEELWGLKDDSKGK